MKYQKQANDLLLKEAKELQLLSKFVQVPHVIHADEYSLILSFIEKATSINWADVGKQLAYLHNQESSYFGFEFDNKIGTTPQYNATSKKIDIWSIVTLFFLAVSQPNGFLYPYCDCFYFFILPKIYKSILVF